MGIRHDLKDRTQGGLGMLQCDLEKARGNEEKYVYMYLSQRSCNLFYCQIITFSKSNTVNPEATHFSQVAPKGSNTPGAHLRRFCEGIYN